MKNIDMKKILIETTYEASINETIETAKETTEVIEENADGERNEHLGRNCFESGKCCWE